ncbi:MAG: ABC-2 family transporter protein [Cyanobacteria bacterium]|jgi:ABC-2 type transport system permease protein|uniref:ABC transporter permease n=1 Tax=Vulcanococcus sp. DEBay_Sum29NL08_54 TaxID=2806303 RepID=UPI0025EC8B92|nr:ABC-2 family transporter protein [Vulcanococcus sp. DEBay_Sum29NL08_54]MDA0964294.1 ABC-2 family transporter protein [Cyanobacteriota bacterium]
MRRSKTLAMLLQFWRSSLESESEYQLNLVLECLSVFGNLAGSLFVLSLLFSGQSTLGGWTWNEALIVLGLYTLLDGFTSCLLQPNLSKIVNHVQQGTLDFVLLKPVDSQLWLSLRCFSPWGAPGLLAGCVLVVLGLPEIRPQSLLLGGLLLASGAAILYSLWFSLAALSIWFVKVWNATEVLRYTLVAGRYPVSAYPPALRLVFVFVLPVAFMTTVPSQALLGQGSWHWALGSVLMAAVSLIASRLFWQFALRHYTSASS